MFVELFGVGRLGGVWCWVVGRGCWCCCCLVLGLELSLVIRNTTALHTAYLFSIVRGRGSSGRGSERDDETMRR